jgi:hypothetical protein
MGRGKRQQRAQARNGLLAAAGPALLQDDGRGLPFVASQASEQEIRHYSGRGCHLLAYVLNQSHGFQLRVLGPPADEHSLLPFGPLSSVRHVYCLNEEGLPLDVHGLFVNEAALQRFSADQHQHDEELLSVDLSVEQLRDELPKRDFRLLYEDELAQTRELTARLGLERLRAVDEAFAPRIWGYSLYQDVNPKTPTVFPHGPQGLAAALRTAERELGFELSLGDGNRQVCLEAEVWTRDFHGRKQDLVRRFTLNALAGFRPRAGRPSSLSDG